MVGVPKKGRPAATSARAAERGMGTMAGVSTDLLGELRHVDIIFRHIDVGAVCERDETRG